MRKTVVSLNMVVHLAETRDRRNFWLMSVLSGVVYRMKRMGWGSVHVFVISYISGRLGVLAGERVRFKK